MYKIFRVVYNDGNWHNGALPHFFYIAKNKSDVIESSQMYKKFLEYKHSSGGDIHIYEVSVSSSNFLFENFKDFNIEITPLNE